MSLKDQSADASEAQFPRKPTGFRMSGVARELHGNVIYSVAWSTDIFDDKDAALSEHHDYGGGGNTSTVNAAASHNKDDAMARTRRQVRYLATCGGNHVSLYEVEIMSDDKKKKPTSDPLILRQAYVDRDSDESFFSCVFGGRSLGRPFGYTPVMDGNKVIFESKLVDDNASAAEKEEENSTASQAQSKKPPSEETKKDDSVDPSIEFQYKLIRAMADTRVFDGPQLLCVAGSRGVIKVIDTVQQMLVMTLSGHGHDIYDLKFSPADEWLLLSASKDESARLWNVKKGACVAIFAGHEAHRNSVLSVAWHPLGHRFASAGMDNYVKIWSIGEESSVHRSLEASKAFHPQKWDMPLDTRPTPEIFRTAYQQTPCFSTNKVHHDYVDCVQFVGDLVLSKSIGNTVVLWKPDFTKTTRSGHGKLLQHTPPNEVIVLREFTTKECDVWFIRFGTDVHCRMLALGNKVGEIKVWDIDENPKKKCFTSLTQQYACTSTVRMVAFCPDTKCLIAACEDASIWKWDAIY